MGPTSWRRARWVRVTAPERAQLTLALCPPERPWLVDSYGKWLQRMKVHALPRLCPRATACVWLGSGTSRGHRRGGVQRVSPGLPGAPHLTTAPATSLSWPRLVPSLTPAGTTE